MFNLTRKVAVLRDDAFLKKYYKCAGINGVDARFVAWESED